MTNTKLLKARLVEMGYTIAQIAEKVGISHTSMSYKVNGKRDFTVKEICLMCSALEITDKDLYFFANVVDTMATE